MQLNLLYICIEFIGLEIQIRRYWDIYTVFKVIRFEFTSGVSGVREKKNDARIKPWDAPKFIGC